MTQAKFLMSLYNFIALNSNAHVTLINKFLDASKMEFLLHTLQVRLKRPAWSRYHRWTWL